MPVPRYYQAKAKLLDLLNERQDNTPFPPERVLSDLFGMSRATIRKALDELVLEGRLVRGAGRRGTAVAPRRPVHRLGLDALVRDLASRESTTVRPAAQDLVVVESVLVHGDEPIGVRSESLRASRFPGLARLYDRTTPLPKFLRDNYGFESAAQPQCATALATPHVAARLEVRAATPLLSVTWLSHDPRGQAVARSAVFLRSDRAHLALPRSNTVDG
ncbi:GntR family transcriptional regulator [Lentzea sp. DG1S-22]|uniref:GntR family transcriptional regulator n=1 Tax=Lentzea sp. DG1S-22 TaxID=3108822 RepID=UPI002E7A2F30|nr:GntR family transcriptional regulator [Lentzea sp. DG1S-22]WVH81455.1 GntR family transcriptional regulator [Lentzea sp. DG1S-22]